MSMLRVRLCLLLAVLMSACVGISAHAAAPQPRPAGVTSPSQIDIPFRDARDAGANSVRFSAAQFTGNAPTVALFGTTKATWGKVKSALQQSAFDGYPVAGVILGPSDAPPALEVYAKGIYVTNPINLETISQAQITKLIEDVWREYY